MVDHGFWRTGKHWGGYKHWKGEHDRYIARIRNLFIAATNKTKFTEISDVLAFFNKWAETDNKMFPDVCHHFEEFMPEPKSTIRCPTE